MHYKRVLNDPSRGEDLASCLLTQSGMSFSQACPEQKSGSPIRSLTLIRFLLASGESAGITTPQMSASGKGDEVIFGLIRVFRKHNKIKKTFVELIDYLFRISADNVILQSG